MPRIVKSQWEFGELFEQQPKRNVLTVTELTVTIRRLLEKQIGVAWVTGEVTNLKVQSSGHIYFTLKDAGAQLSCVLFRGETQVDRSLLQDGRGVIVRGDVTVYEPRGQYQFRVTAVELQGAGALQLAFEKLKQKLNAEGLFAPERKRPLPPYPRRVGVVTSPTGAAIRDVLHVIGRRNRALEIVLVPCRVQGQGAGDEIAVGIRLLNDFSARQIARGAAEQALDVILVTRGGGSLEDLWAFNEEVVARAIFDSAVPVVSAVGHEIDFTISDFVADLRAATPSAAAEILTEGVFSSCQYVSEAGERLRQLIGKQLESKSADLLVALRHLARLSPRRRCDDLGQRLDDFRQSMARCSRHMLRHHTRSWANAAARLGRFRPAEILIRQNQLLKQARVRLIERTRSQLEQLKHQQRVLDTRLRLLGPEQVLARGYSITTDPATGRVLRKKEEVSPGQQIRTRLASGEISSRVERD